MPPENPEQWSPLSLVPKGCLLTYAILWVAIAALLIWLVAHGDFRLPKN